MSNAFVFRAPVPHGLQFAPSRRPARPSIPDAGRTRGARAAAFHPFPDGNGRTGRALIHAMLRGHGLTRNVTVPVSAGLLTDTLGHFGALTAHRDGEPAAIVETLAHASFAAAANGRQLVLDLRAIRLSWGAKLKVR